MKIPLLKTHFLESTSSGESFHADLLSKNVMAKNDMFWSSLFRTSAFAPAFDVGCEDLSAPICVKQTDFGEGTLKLHYFWGSTVVIQIYCICFAALVTRQLWILHGITIILLREMAEKLFVWGEFFAESADFRNIKQNISWLVNFGWSQAEKVIQVGGFRTVVAGSTLRVCMSIGPSYLFLLIRAQHNEINNRIVSETRDMIDQIERSRIKSIHRLSSFATKKH
jgi:hypothetical protein